MTATEHRITIMRGGLLPPPSTPARRQAGDTREIRAEADDSDE
jgi:hypothetical protein